MSPRDAACFEYLARYRAMATSRTFRVEHNAELFHLAGKLLRLVLLNGGPHLVGRWRFSASDDPETPIILGLDDSESFPGILKRAS